MASAIKVMQSPFFEPWLTPNFMQSRKTRRKGLFQDNTCLFIEGLHNFRNFELNNLVQTQFRKIKLTPHVSYKQSTPYLSAIG